MLVRDYCEDRKFFVNAIIVLVAIQNAIRAVAEPKIYEGFKTEADFASDTMRFGFKLLT